MAVKGKLVPQDPNDEPASVLLERIRAEKEQLIKEGKIKKEKNPSRIFRGADNLPYEQIGKNEPVCIADEVPFDIPESWEWVRWGTASLSIQYGYNAPAQQSGRIRMVRISDIQNNQVLWETVPFCDIAEENIETYLLKENDILFARTGGTVGKSFLVKNTSEEAIYAGYLIRTRYNSKNIYPQYLKYFMESDLYWSQLRVGTIATAQPNCNGKTLSHMILPLPPYDEQIRIVSKLNDLVLYLDKYESTDSQLKELQTVFPENLKKSILQWAVQGKLVPQDPNDEPASVLLERIRTEKEQFIKAGKIKGDKHKSVIYRRDNSHYEKLNGTLRCIDDEIPFEIPDTWAWCRLGQLVYNHGQMTPSKNFCYIDISSINNNHQKLSDVEHIITAEKAPSRAKKIVRYGDILYSTVRPYLHNMCIINRKFSHTPIASTGFAVMCCSKNYYNKFLFYYLMSPFFDSYANDIDNAKGVAYPAINDQRLYNALIPVPPLTEQQRIVSRIENLMSVINVI